jgi:hypothetical protein
MPRHTGVTVIVAGLIALCSMLLPGVAGAAPLTGITGTVTNASSGANPPVENLNVCVSKKGGGSSTCIATSGGGKYTLEVEVGEYEVRFTGSVCVSSGGNFICTQEYVEKVVSPVQVTLGNLTEVNGPLLEVDGKISGRVTAGGAPVASIDVCAFGAGAGGGCHATNSGGEYTIEHLAPGSYTVSFRSLVPPSCKVLGCQRANYITQYWNGQPTSEAANAVVVKESETTPGINAELQAGGHIAGRVTSASIYAPPIAGIRVCVNSTALNKEGESIGEGECAITNANGEYTIQTLASGGYEVEFTGELCVESGGKVKCNHPYLGQYYQGLVLVSAPGTTSPINGSLLERLPTKPVNTGAPTVTAAKTLVATASPLLSCSPGSWGNNPTSLAYRWLRNGVAIAGQTANTYTVQSADAGHGISCEVTASNAAGASAAMSNTLQVPKPASGVAVFKGASVAGSTVSIKLLCTGASACSGVLKLLTKLTAGHRGHQKTRNVTDGLASFSMGLGKSLTLRIHLTRQGRKLLGRAGRGGLKAQIAGNGVRAHTVVLRAPSKRHG